MENLIINTNPEIENKFNSYPECIRPKLELLRDLVRQVAVESKYTEELEETLKWGEPSFLTKKGSTLRMDWKAKAPDQYAMYFKCTSKLIPTIKDVYGDKFKYENNRAILFDLEESIPKEDLKVCIRLALQYHKLKDKPRLGL